MKFINLDDNPDIHDWLCHEMCLDPRWQGYDFIAGVWVLSSDTWALSLNTFPYPVSFMESLREAVKSLPDEAEIFHSERNDLFYALRRVEVPPPLPPLDLPPLPCDNKKPMKTVKPVSGIILLVLWIVFLVLCFLLGWHLV